MKQTAALKAPVTLEEILNAVTHGVGAALAVAALIGMLVYYAGDGVWHTTSCLVYGISLILLYLASTLYHSFTNRKVKSVFKVIDHAAIFVLIAGNYTPFALIPLRGRSSRSPSRRAIISQPHSGRLFRSPSRRLIISQPHSGRSMR